MTIDHDHDSLVGYPFGSRRSAILASGGVVATSQPLAAQAGLGVLADGGTAVDAAIATAAALTVVEPCSNGIGSDAFAIVWDGERLHGLNGSGRWPAAGDAGQLRAAGHDAVPQRGWTPVTVPGAVDTWDELHRRFGRLPVERLLAPAIGYAEPTGTPCRRSWPGSGRPHRPTSSPPRPAGTTPSWPTGPRCSPRPAGRPGPGSAGPLPATPGACARWPPTGCATSTRGRWPRAIASYAERHRRAVDRGADLAAHRAEWVDPIGVDYQGHRVWEIPPNGQGIAALLALGMLERTDLAGRPQIDAGAWHLQIEAMKLAFADNDAYVGDQAAVDVPVAGLLDPAYLDRRAALIGDRAGPAPRGEPSPGRHRLPVRRRCRRDDGQLHPVQLHGLRQRGGRAVARDLAPEPGGLLRPRRGPPQRGRARSPAPPHDHPRLPDHRDAGEPVGPFGVMGGEMQPQGHVQVVSGMVDHGRNPQAALDAPRWQVERDGRVRVEPQVPDEVVTGLRDRGHEVIVEPSRLRFGRGQIIVRSSDGVYAAGSEPRADGCAVGI